MIGQKKRTVRFETSSLLPLKLVLIEAEKDLPARTPKEHDVNEELALKLIAAMKKLSFDSAATFPLVGNQGRTAAPLRTELLRAERSDGSITVRTQSKRSSQQNSFAVKSNCGYGYVKLEP